MKRHGYSDLPEYCFWDRSVVAPAPHEVDPVVAPKFRIDRCDRVATAGGCFARHVSRGLAAAGFSYFVTESAHPLFPQALATEYNYGVFSARYGAICTARQLRQLLQRAYGRYAPQEDVWQGEGGRVVDPYRPAIQPRGFASAAELSADRRQHFAAVRLAVERMDVFVFTLGLTEAWTDARDGTVFPLCPGVAGGEFDAGRHRFCNFDVGEVVADLNWTLDFIASVNPRCRTILTVSPVPLAATGEDRSVLVSTSYSKSVLRVAAGEIARRNPRVAYFPAYEIVAGAHARGAYYASDLRSVTDAGVAHVVRLFMKHYAAQAGASPPAMAGDEAAGRRVAEMQDAASVV